MAGCFILMAGCVTQETPKPQGPPKPRPAVQYPAPPPTGTEIDWANSSWIIREEGKKSSDSNYRGFHFAKDGSLLLINFEHATGKNWIAEQDQLTISLLEQSSKTKIAGTYKVFAEDTSDDSETVRLVKNGGAEGWMLEKRQPAVDLVENLWKIRSVLKTDATIRHIRNEVELIILPNMDGGLYMLIYNDVNRFRANVSLGVNVLEVGGIAGGQSQKGFENLILKPLTSSNRYVRVDYDFFLYNETRQQLALRTGLFH